MNRIHVPHRGATQERLFLWMGGTTLVALFLAFAFAAGTRTAPANVADPSPAAMSDQPQTRRLGVREAAVQYLQFEPNQGQAAKAVRYLSRGPKHDIEVFDDGIALSAQGLAGHGAGPSPLPARTEPARAQLRFVGASDRGRFESREAAAGHANYLTGGDASKWIRDVPRYRQLRYADLYPGIDLVYYSRDGELEFDLVVKAGADPSRIRLHVGGAEAPVIADNGDLLLDGLNGALRLHRPVLYQNIDGEKRVLDAQYVLGADRALGFALPAYDKRYPLIIDPVFKLLYSTYLTGFHDEQVGGMAMDAQGNAYIVGQTTSDDFVVSGNAYQTGKSTTGLQYNAVVTKFDASGTLIYSTYIGGSGSDIGAAIAVDAFGNAYLTGNTTSRDFPVTSGAHQATFTGTLNAYLAVLSPDGSALVHSTFYGGGGSVQANSIALDASGAAVISGSAGPGLVTTAGAYKTTLATGNAAFIAKFSAIAGGAPRLLAASYFGVDNPQANGTSQGNSAFSMALDAGGAPWITGQAYTTNLPVTAAAVQASPASMSPSCAAGPGPLNSFAFVAKLSADLASLAYASYLTGATEPAGGAACAEFGRAIALDAGGNVYVTGGTASAAFPTTAGAVQTAFPSAAGVASYTGFVAKLKPDGSAIVWSTYLGGNGGNTFPAAIAMDPGANAVWTTSVTGGGSNYPVTTDALQKVHGGGGADVGLVQLDATTGTLKYSTFLGGASADVGLAVGIDPGGNAFVAGNTFSPDFPITANAYESAFRPDFFGGADWFFSVLGNGAIATVQPRQLGTGGSATLSVRGVGLQQGAVGTLVSGAVQIASVNADIGADGNSAQFIFDLGAAAAGSYDIVIRNPDGSSLVKAAAVSLSAGGKPDIWTSVVGRPVIRTGVPSTFQFTVGNAGSVDAYFTTVWIGFPEEMGFALRKAPVDPLNPEWDIASTALVHGSDGRAYLELMLPRIAAGATVPIAVDLTSPTASSNVAIDIYTRDPWFDSFAKADAFLSRIVATPASAPGACSIDAAKPYLSECFADFNARVSQSARSSLLAQEADGVPVADLANLPQSEVTKVVAQYLLSGLHVSAAASGSAAGMDRARNLALAPLRARPQLALPVVIAVGTIVAGAIVGDIVTNWLHSHQGSFFNCYGASTKLIATTKCVNHVRTETWRITFKGNPSNSSCQPIIWKEQFTCDPEDPKPTPVCTYHQPPASVGRSQALGLGSAAEQRMTPASARAQPTASGGTCPSSGGAVDPNDKFGSLGDGSAAHFVRPGPALSYTVAFENLPTAALAAAQVVVTDRLDPAKVDVASVALGTISFGKSIIDVPSGRNSFATIHAIDSTKSVRIQGSVDAGSGMLKWTFTTIDPATGLPPSDPTLGFLPPDTDGMKGQGYVSFTVQPKSGLPDGTVFSNQASIVFDANSPIVTPTWINTLDATRPVSRVQSVTPRAGTASLDVTWAGSDTGSGARSFSVYVSDNGGPFSPWQTSLSANTATFDGTPGHAYGFHVIATDGAGNTEAAKSSAEASGTAGDASGSGSADSSSGGGCTLGGDGHRDAALPLLVLFAAGWLALARRRSRRRAQP